MEENEDILSQFFYHDDDNHLFKDCYKIEKKLKEEVKRTFLYKLQCADSKYRYSIYAYEEIRKICENYDWQKSIYLEDQERLKLSFYVESYLVLSRACIDLSISAYFAYFHDSKNLDSFHDFIKKISKEDQWIPFIEKHFWLDLISKYKENDYNELKAFLGSDNGVSLRDKVVHKGNLYIEAVNYENSNQEVLAITLNNKYYSPLFPWLLRTQSLLTSILDQVKRDILIVDSGQLDIISKLSNSGSQ